MSEALQAYAATMAGALDSLLMSHAALVVHTLDAKITEQSNRMGQELAALIAHKLQSTVRGIMEQELGGPLGSATTAPAPASDTATATPVYAPKPAPEPAPSPEPPKPSRQLKVDVVGLNTPAMEQLVKAAFNGETDIRFFDPDSKNSYAPHRDRECIMLTHRIPHVLKDKIRAAKVEPLYVKPTPGHVIHAIEELLRARAVAQAAHQH
jgi:predicted component of type VI protein secretion system